MIADDVACEQALHLGLARFILVEIYLSLARDLARAARGLGRGRERGKESLPHRCHSDLGTHVFWVPRTQIPSVLGIPVGIPKTLKALNTADWGK